MRRQQLYWILLGYKLEARRIENVEFTFGLMPDTEKRFKLQRNRGLANYILRNRNPGYLQRSLDGSRVGELRYTSNCFA